MSSITSLQGLDQKETEINEAISKIEAEILTKVGELALLNKRRADAQQTLSNFHQKVDELVNGGGYW